MTVLVVGASGRTGRLVVEQLLARGHEVRAMLRSAEGLCAAVRARPGLRVVEASVLALPDAELARHVAGCDAVVSCLGHGLDLRGLFGEPRRLCADATRRLCEAIVAGAPAPPAKLILMNTVGVPNPAHAEVRSPAERLLLWLLRHAVPPHRDNELAAAYLYEQVGRGIDCVEWCVVRPDSLVDAEPTEYAVERSPCTGILSGRPTRRANVARFMVALVEDGALWRRWRFEAPVVMDALG